MQIVGQYEDEVAQLREQHQLAMQTVGQYEDEVAQLREQHQLAMQTVGQYEDEVAQLREQHQLAMQTVGQYEDEVAQLREQHQLAMQTVGQYEDEVAQLREQHQLAMQTVGQYEEEVAQLREQNQLVMKTVGQYEERTHQAEQIAEQVQQTAQQAEEEVAQLREQHQLAMQTVTHYEEDNVRLQVACQEYRQRMMELELEKQARAEGANTEGEPPQKPSWVISKDEVSMTQEEIGRGGWGNIRIALFRGQKVAAKTIHQQIISAHNDHVFSREMYLSSTLRHPNILLFIGATIEGQPIILTELMETSLRKIYEQNAEPEPLTKDLTLSILRDIAKGLNYLHLIRPDPLIHRDISSANVLLESSTRTVWKAKLSDFGSTNFLSQTTTLGPGNALYAAPEAYTPPPPPPPPPPPSTLQRWMCSVLEF